jgi:hypothetical protein
MFVTGGTGQTPADITGGQPVAGQCAWPAGAIAGSGLSDGVVTWGVTQRWHPILVDCDDFAPLYVFAGADEHAAAPIDPGIPPGPGTISTTLWKQSANPNGGGSPLDVQFAGALSYALGPEQILRADPVAGPWHAGDWVYERTLTVVASGGKFPLGTKTYPQGDPKGDGGRQGTGSPSVDYLHGGTIPSVNPETRFGMCGTWSSTVHTPSPVVALVGTSIDEGTSAVGHEADIVQACSAAGLPCIRLARGGESALMFNTAGNHEIRRALAAQATDVVCGHLVNDFKQYSDWVACATVIRACHQLLRGVGGGRRVWQLTAPPSYAKDYTTPSDHSASIRVPVNDWFRAGCPESAGGVPVAPGTPGAVPSGYTGDFTHPNGTGHAAGAAAFNVQRFWTAFGGTPPLPPPPPPPPAASVPNLVKIGGAVVRLP